MAKYLGVYDEEWVQLFCVRVIAEDYEEARIKFRTYLVKELDGRYFEDEKMYIFSDEEIETIL